MLHTNPAEGDGSVRPIGVLIVDDQGELLTILSRGLSKLMIPVVQSDDPTEALHMAMSDCDIGVVVSDIQMPTMDGVDLISSIKECCRDRPWMQYVVMTGYASLETATASIKLGVSDFLQKPFNATQFREVVLRAIVRARNIRSQTLAMEASSSRLAGGRIAANDSSDDGARDHQGAPVGQRDATNDSAFAQALLGLRRARFKSLPAEAADDVALTILLELFHAAASGKEVSYTGACSIDGVSPSTAQRRVQDMLGDGILLKNINGKENRRYSLSLSEKGMEIASSYLNLANKYVTSRL